MPVATDLVSPLLELAADDVAGCAGDDLLVEVVALERLRGLLDARQLHVLAELEVRGVTDTAVGLSTHAWVDRETTASSGATRRRVRAGKALRSCAVLDAALLAGEIGIEHVEVLLQANNRRIEDLFVQMFAGLIAQVALLPFREWRQLVGETARLLDEDGGFDPNREPTTNKLTRTVGVDGLVTITITLTAANGELVVHAITQLADEQRRINDADVAATGGEIEPLPNDTLEAQALIELVRRGLGLDLDSSKPARPEATFIIPTDETRTDGGPIVFGRNGNRLPDGSVDHLLDGADFYSVVLNSLGVPIDTGRRVRFATETARRALRARDGGCVFPGCTAPPHWCDAHHLKEWILGGGTDEANLCLLCRHHHGVIHRTGWTIVRKTDGYFDITTPTGQTLESQRHHRRRAPAEQAAAHERHRARASAPPGRPPDPPGTRHTTAA